MTQERREIALAWLRKAESDFAYARLGLEADHSYGAGTVFHCHQTAEKGLKAVLSFHGIMPPKTHDLLRLLELVSPHLEHHPLIEAAVFLTPLATDFRYPGDTDLPSEEDVRVAFEFAAKFLEMARETIK